MQDELVGGNMRTHVSNLNIPDHSQAPIIDDMQHRTFQGRAGLICPFVTARRDGDRRCVYDVRLGKKGKAGFAHISQLWFFF